jgi:hypothetical protein
MLIVPVPGPLMVMLLFSCGNGEAKLIVPVTLILITWLPGPAALALFIASRREPAPVLLVFVTVKVAASAVLPKNISPAAKIDAIERRHVYGRRFITYDHY